MALSTRSRYFHYETLAAYVVRFCFVVAAWFLSQWWHYDLGMLFLLICIVDMLFSVVTMPAETDNANDFQDVMTAFLMHLIVLLTPAFLAFIIWFAIEGADEWLEYTLIAMTFYGWRCVCIFYLPIMIRQYRRACG